MSKETKKPRTRKRGEWCEYGGKPGLHKVEIGEKGRHVRCPKCGKRLLPAYAWEENWSWNADQPPDSFYIPKHKTSKVK